MTPIHRRIRLLIMVTLCLKATGQQLTCEGLGLDSTIQRVIFIEQQGAPFDHAGFHAQSDAKWYSMNIDGHDITQVFLSEVPTNKGHAQWIPSYDGLEAKGMLNGDYIINSRGVDRIYTFNNGLLIRMVVNERNSIEIYYFNMIVNCGVPIIIHSNQWHIGNIFPTPIRNATFPYGQTMIIFDCQGTAGLFRTLCGEELRAKLCKKEGIR